MLESKSSALTNLATPLHGSPTEVVNRYMSRRTANGPTLSGHPTSKRMNGQVAALANLPIPRGSVELHVVRHRCEDCASGAGHPCRQTLGAEPFDGIGDRRAEPLGNR